MIDSAQEAATAFSNTLRTIPSKEMDKERCARAMLVRDPMEMLVQAKLLEEGLSNLQKELAPGPDTVILFLDRAGGKDGAKAAAAAMPLMGEFWPGASFIHVSFATQAQGLGTLVRNILAQVGAKNRMAVHVVAHNRPAKALSFDKTEIVEAIKKCNLVVTCAYGGVAGLGFQSDAPKDPFIARSHLCVLSYPDPESVVASLGELRGAMDKESFLKSIRFRVQIKKKSDFEDLGNVEFGRIADMASSLGSLIDAAAGYEYRILAEPIASVLLDQDPLIYPSESHIRTILNPSCAILRIVPAGSKLIAVGRGRETLI